MKKLLVVVLSCLCVAAFAGNFQWNTSVYEGYVNAGASWNGGVEHDLLARLCGTFKADGGVITMTATPTPGMLLIFR